MQNIWNQPKLYNRIARVYCLIMTVSAICITENVEKAVAPNP